MIQLEELIRQDYDDCSMSAGKVIGHATDTIYLKFERVREEPTWIYLREDEALSIMWLLSGALWSSSVASLIESAKGI